MVEELVWEQQDWDDNSIPRCTGMKMVSQKNPSQPFFLCAPTSTAATQRACFTAAVHDGLTPLLSWSPCSALPRCGPSREVAGRSGGGCSRSSTLVFDPFWQWCCWLCGLRTEKVCRRCRSAVWGAQVGNFTLWGSYSRTFYLRGAQTQIVDHDAILSPPYADDTIENCRLPKYEQDQNNVFCAIVVVTYHDRAVVTRGFWLLAQGNEEPGFRVLPVRSVVGSLHQQHLYLCRFARTYYILKSTLRLYFTFRANECNSPRCATL